MQATHAWGVQRSGGRSARRVDDGVLAGVVRRSEVRARSLIGPRRNVPIAPHGDQVPSLFAGDAATPPVVDLTDGGAKANTAQLDDSVDLGEPTSVEVCSEPFGPRHAIQYAESESDVNRLSAAESESATNPGSKLDGMSAAEKETPEPVTAFTRFLIEDWVARGRKLTDLAVAGGFCAPGEKSSMPSQVRGGSSKVTNDAGPKFAQAFGYPDYPSYVLAAYRWVQTKSLESNEPHDLIRAVRFAMANGVTKEQIERVIAQQGQRGIALGALEWLALFTNEKLLDERTRPPLLTTGRDEDSSTRRRKPR